MSAAPEIARMLVLSTGHLRPTTRNWIDVETPWACYPKGEYGWFMYVCDDVGLVGDGTPGELQVIITHARDLGCEWVVFDVDGPELDGLVVFEEIG